MNRTTRHFPKALILSALLTTQGALAGNTADEESYDRSDLQEAWIEGKLDTIYLVNRHLNNFAIDVDVEDSRVTLEGKVESEVDRDLAEEIARSVDGIDNVDNRLEIVHSDDARDEEGESRRDFAEKLEDATLAAEVKIKLMANAEVKARNIDVDTLDDEVILVGEVESSAEKDLAEQIARNVDGVEAVRNKLRIKS